MTTVLGRYVILQVLLGTAFALLLLAALDMVFALISELGDVGRGRYGLWEAMAYVLLTLPRRIYEMVPSAALLGSLLWLGNLASNSEITAMRASGVTFLRLMSWVLQGGLVVVLGMIALGEFVAPAAEQRAQNLKAAAFDDRLSVRRGVLWARDGNRIVYSESVLPGDRLAGVRVMEFDDKGELDSISWIQSAEYEQGRWRMSGVARSFPTRDGVLAEHREDEIVGRLLSPEYFSVLALQPRQMAAGDLARYIRYLQGNRLDTAVYEVAFWQRITLPASTWVMLLLALPFLFGSQREGGAGTRLFIGLLLGVSFAIVMRLMTHMGLVYGLPPWFSASAPLWLFLMLAAILLWRVRV